jgi:hypothetical protein
MHKTLSAQLALAAVALAVFAVGSEPLRAQERQVLSGYTPARITSRYGVVSEVKFSTGLIALPPKVLAYLPEGGMRQLKFSENVWVIGYRTEISDERGDAVSENLICHTLFCDQRAAQRQDQRMRALYSDGFTRGFQLPEGYAVPFSRLDDIHLMAMFNNRTDAPKRVRMNIELILIRERDLRQPLQPLYSTLRSVNIPHLYFVPPNRHERETTFQLPFEGRIHFIGTHIHPYAESVAVFDVSRKEEVWRGRTRLEAAEHRQAMETYSSVSGYPVHPGQLFRLSCVYDNPTSSKIDAMAAAFIYYSEN